MSKGLSIMVVGVVPAHLEHKLTTGKLVPAQLVLDAIGANGLTAGAPEMIPVRALAAQDVVVAMNKAMELGHIMPVVAFQVVPQAERPRIVAPEGNGS